MRTVITTTLALSVVFSSAYVAAETNPKPRPLQLSLQRRDPQTDKIKIQPETIDSSKIGVVVIDMWNGTCARPEWSSLAEAWFRG